MAQKPPSAPKVQFNDVVTICQVDENGSKHIFQTSITDEKVYINKDTGRSISRNEWEEQTWKKGADRDKSSPENTDSQED